MRRKIDVRRTSMKVAGLALVAGLAVAACGPVKMGAAAITGQDRISAATLTNEVANLDAAYQTDSAKGVHPQRPKAQQVQQVLTWLILFRVYDKMAMRQGVSVTPTDVQTQRQLVATTASQQKLTAGEYVSAAGALPPDLLLQFARLLAIQTALKNKFDGGRAPTGTTGQNAVTARIDDATCVAAKDLGIQVNPQFGEWDYNSFGVVLAPAKLAVAMPSPSASKPAAVRLKAPC
jgi:hypothetical protein